MYRYVKTDLTLSKYPLLGRENEMKIFQEMLNNMIEYSTLKHPKAFNKVNERTKDNMNASYSTLIIKQANQYVIFITQHADIKYQ